MTEFFKVSGGGNDFIALVEPEREPGEEAIRAWCARGLSLGADGLFVLARTAGGARMRYFNADGRAATLCINGTRCAARLALELGWSDGEVAVETGAGTFSARPAGAARIALALPRPPAPRERAVEALGALWRGWEVRVGVPHFVLLRPEGLARAPLAELGPALRHHPAFAPGGTNVDLACFPASGRVEVRSWERGVEGETLACGSGVLAAAAAGLAAGEARLPLDALTAGGFVLAVAEGSGGSWSLAGDARILARGTLTPEAGQLPPRPGWSG